MTRRSRLDFVASLSISVAASAAALMPARTSAQETDQPLQAAKADFEEGQTLFTRERYDDAAARFLSAYDKKPFSSFVFNAAVSYEKAKKIHLAVKFFEKYLEAAEDHKDAADVRARVASLKAMIAPPPTTGGAAPPPRAAAVLPAIATKGLVIIDSKPQGATVYLDDKAAGPFAKTPWQGSLPPKPVKVIVEAKGFKPEERDISPRTDKLYEIYVALSEEHFLGWIEVASNVAGAEVFIDRRDIGAMGKTPYTGHLKPGKHTVWVQRPGYLVAQEEIDVQPGTATTHMVTLEKAPIGWISLYNKQNKGAVLKVDGKVACTAPCQHEVLPGRHQIVVERQGMKPYRGEILVDKATESQVTVGFLPVPPRTKAWVLTVISATLLGGGIAVGLQANKLERELKRDAAAPDKLIDSGDPRVKRGKYFAIGADVAFGMSAVIGITAAINFLTSGPDSTADVDARAVSVAPLPGGGGSLALAGRF